MKFGWIAVGLAGAVVVAAWSAVAITYFLFDPGIVVWTAVVTVAAFATEGFLWVCAGALGWSIFAGRRRILERLKRQFFGER